MDGSEPIKTRFTELIGFIDNAINEIQDGTVTDLDDLDARVASLCEEVEQANPDIAREVKPLMGEMIGKLDELAAGLADFQSALEEKKAQ